MTLKRNEIINPKKKKRIEEVQTVAVTEEVSITTIIDDDINTIIDTLEEEDNQ